MWYGLFILFDLIGVQCSSRLIKVNYFPHRGASSRIRVKINSLQRYCNMAIDITSHLTWILGSSNNEASPNKAISERQDLIGIPYGNHIIRGKDTTSLITLSKEQDTIIEFDYYIIEDIPQSYRGIHNVLGLSFLFPNEKHSLLHRLKEQGLINHLSFSFLADKRKENYFCIGALSSEDLSNQTHSHCEVIGRDGHWDCFLSRVIVYSKSNEVVVQYNASKERSDYSYFNTVDDYVSAPEAFMKRLHEEYFDELIDSKHCLAYGFRNKTQIACLKERITEGCLLFHIEDMQVRFKWSDFWDCSVSASSYCKLLLMGNPLGDYWIIGMSFIGKINMQFDYEEKRIYFYSVDRITINSTAKGKSQALYSSLISLLIILIVGTAFMVYLSLLLKNKAARIKSAQ